MDLKQRNFIYFLCLILSILILNDISLFMGSTTDSEDLDGKILPYSNNRNIDDDHNSKNQNISLPVTNDRIFLDDTVGFNYNSHIYTKLSTTEDSLDELYKFQRLVSIQDYQGVSNLTEHIGDVNSVAYSPNGTMIASGSSDETIKIWNVTTGEVIHSINEHGGEILSIAFNPNGSLLASGSDDRTIKIWNITTGERIHTLSGHTGIVQSVAFSPNGSLLASGASDKKVMIWNANTGGSPIHTLAGVDGHTDWVFSVAFSPNNSLVASASGDRKIKLWDVNTGNYIQDLIGHSNTVESVSFSSDGKYLASASSDNDIKLWNGTTGTHIDTLSEHEEIVRSVTFSPDNELLISGSNDEVIKIWNITTRSVIHNLTGHVGDVTSVSVSPNGNYLVSGSTYDIVKLWNINLGRKNKTLNEHSTEVYSVAFNNNNNLLASGSNDKSIIIWNVTSGEFLKQSNAHVNWVASVVFSPNGSILASGSYDQNIKLWEVSTMNEIDVITAAHGSGVRSLAFHPNGSLLVSCSADNTIKMWDVNTRNRIDTLIDHIEPVLTVAVSPDGKTIVSGSIDNTIKIWNLTKRELITTLENHSEDILCIAYSPDGNMLASSSKDNSILLWDVNSWTITHNLSGHSLDVRSLAFSLEGDILASGSYDKTIKIWNVTNGKEIRSLKSNYPVYSIDFNYNNELLACGFLSTGKIQVWNGGTSIFGFENDSSSLVVADSVLDIYTHPISLLSASWDTSSVLPIANASSVRAPSSFGPHTLHTKIDYLSTQFYKDYQLFVIKSLDDYDGDGIPNYWEDLRGLDKLKIDGGDDPDYDGLSNFQEFEKDTEPHDPDTDKDGWKDGPEVTANSNPLIPNDPPVVTWPANLTALDNGKTNVSTWTWYVNETNAINLELWLNDNSRGIRNDNLSWIVNLQEGSNNITVRAFYDFAYNSNSVTFLITLDTAPPSIIVTHPTIGGVYQSNTPITISIEGFSGATYYYWDNGSFDIASSLTFNLPSQDGVHTLHLRAMDEIGNVQNAAFSFTTDNTKPTAVIKGMSDEMSGINVIQVLPDDKNPIDRVEFELAGEIVEADSTEPYIWKWDSSTVQDGRYIIRIFVYDVAENKFTSTFENVLVINNPVNIVFRFIAQNIVLILIVIALALIVLAIYFIYPDKRIHILFLYADPNQDFDPTEFDKIENDIQREEYGDKINLIKRDNLTSEKFEFLLRKYKPDIVQISSHGKKGNLLFHHKDDISKGDWVSKDAIIKSFRQHKKRIKIVIISACDSKELGRGLKEFIDFVITLSTDTMDDAAKEFVVGFYNVLASGDNVEEAFNSGKTRMVLIEKHGEEIPEKDHRDGVDPKKIKFFKR